MTAAALSETEIASALADAESRRADVVRFTLADPDLDLAAAYRVQARNIARRTDGGHPRVGVKLGLTSRAKQQQMGVAAPLTGILTADMTLGAGAPVPTAELIHARVEPEIAFVLAADLVGPGITADDARAAVASVHAALEIIDSRYRDFDFRLPDVVADNASSARYVLSSAALAPHEIDVTSEPVALVIDGETVATATGAATMGDPYVALALAANDLATRGDRLRAGEVVLSGALTDARPLLAGTVAEARFATLGTISVTAE